MRKRLFYKKYRSDLELEVRFLIETGIVGGASRIGEEVDFLALDKMDIVKSHLWNIRVGTFQNDPVY